MLLALGSADDQLGYRAVPAQNQNGTNTTTPSQSLRSWYGKMDHSKFQGRAINKVNVQVDTQWNIIRSASRAVPSRVWILEITLELS